MLVVLLFCRTTYDELLAGPPGDDINAAVPRIPRATATYASYDDRFKIQSRDYDRQFAQVYFYRLVKVRPHAEAAARAAWPGVPVVRVLDIPEQGEVFVVGTLYKEMALKPSIMDEYTKERALGAALGRTRFTQADDRFVLEDEGARVTLTGTGFDPGQCVTGVVAAVKGSVLPNGEFEVSAVCFAGIPPQPPLPTRMEEDGTEGEGDKYVALVSGLASGDGDTNPLRLQLLVDYCAGALGGATEQATAARIARVIVAGDLLKGTADLSQPTAYSTVRQQAIALAPVRDADLKLTELAGAVPVDAMPGAADPANYSLPQQPLHRCLFPGAAPYSTFTRCTNPHEFDLDGVRFLGTSGQNVDDVVRYSNLDSRVEILEKLLTWRHLIPTAPDTLAAYPYIDADPFILEEAPHVLFAGCQPEFGTAMVTGQQGQAVRVVAVPNFSATGTMVLLNLRTLAVHPVQFNADLEG